MISRIGHGVLISITAIALLSAYLATSYSGTTYTYDELNRLNRVDYGDGTVIEYVYDSNGNRLEIRVPGPDTTPPTTTASPPGGVYAPGQTVTLMCNDGSGWGCDKIYYTTDGSTPTTSSAIYSAPVPVSNTTLKFFATDLAMNSESVKTETYTTDAMPPSGTITINSGAAYTNTTNVTLSLTCSDAHGCSQMQFSNDDVIYSDPEAYATSKAWTLTTDDEIKTVYVRFKDTPGNWSSPASDTILLDTTAPITIASPPGGVYAGTVTLTCYDGPGSGCDKIYYTADGSTPTTSSAIYSAPIPVSNTTLKFFATDLATNSESVETEVYSAPQVMIGSVGYSTIQAAYNAAVNGDMIKCRELTYIENLTVNGDIAVTLEGGYDAGFTTNYGKMTSLKGTLTTTVGGGTITIKNFTFVQ